MDLDEAFRLLRAKNAPIPRPMRLPTPQEVDDVEGKLGSGFHPDFRRYLIEVSDVVFGIMEPVTVTRADSHTDLLKVADVAWSRYGVPRELTPICEYNADFYCINAAGEVIFWSHNGWTETKWPNLANWIEEVWLEDFDSA